MGVTACYSGKKEIFAKGAYLGHVSIITPDGLTSQRDITLKELKLIKYYMELGADKVSF